SIQTVEGTVLCRPVFELTAAMCARYTPERVESICGIAARDTERAAQLLWESRPVAYYAWSGVEMQSNATQISRAIAQLYVLTGNLDSPGGNVLFAGVRANSVTGEEFMTPERNAR